MELRLRAPLRQRLRAFVDQLHSVHDNMTENEPWGKHYATLHLAICNRHFALNGVGGGCQSPAKLKFR